MRPRPKWEVPVASQGATCGSHVLAAGSWQPAAFLGQGQLCNAFSTISHPCQGWRTDGRTETDRRGEHESDLEGAAKLAPLLCGKHDGVNLRKQPTARLFS